MLNAYHGNKKVVIVNINDNAIAHDDETPMLYVTVPNVEGVADAICNSIKDYFVSK